jgi:hypothetical protein
LQLVDLGEVPYDVSEIIPDDLNKAEWLGSVSAIDSKDERSGLLTHIATTESFSLCTRMKS